MSADPLFVCASVMHQSTGLCVCDCTGRAHLSVSVTAVVEGGSVIRHGTGHLSGVLLSHPP